MKRSLALLLAVLTCLGCTACRRTDSLTDGRGPAAADPTREPPREAVYAEGFVTPAPTVPADAGSAASVGSGANADLPSADDPGAAPAGDAGSGDAGIPDAGLAGDPDTDHAGLAGDGAPEEPADPDEPAEPDPYSCETISNATLKVQFSYPQGWTSSPSTDVITMVEPVDEGDVPARVSVTSYQYTEAKPSNKKLKGHLGAFLVSALSSYNEYKLESTAAVSFVGSSGMSATYLAIQGNSYIRGVVYAGYTKATKKKKGRVYILHFCCEDADFEGFLPLAEKLAASVSETD